MRRVIEVPKIELANGHWVFEDFRQRMTVAQWRQILLDGRDHVVFRGNLVSLKAKNLGAGVVEITKKKAAKEVKK